MAVLNPGGVVFFWARLKIEAAIDGGLGGFLDEVANLFGFLRVGDAGDFFNHGGLKGGVFLRILFELFEFGFHLLRPRDLLGSARSESAEGRGELAEVGEARE